jgi:hypothetical protein
MLRISCRTFVAEDMRRKVEKGVVGSVGIGGDGGVRAVECIESAWGKWTSQLVHPYSDGLTLGTYSEYFLLPRSCPHSNESEIVFNNVVLSLFS